MSLFHLFDARHLTVAIDCTTTLYIQRYSIHHFHVLPRGFSATYLQQMQGSVVEGLSQTARSSSQWFFV